MPADRPTVALIGTLDTKSDEHAFVRDRLRDAGVDVVVVDVGVLGEPAFEPDIPAADVARAAGVELADLRFTREGSDTRALALTTMGRGAAVVVRRLLDEGRCDGAMGLGGSGGSTVVSIALRALPLGVPKLLVSTMTSGNVGGFVGTSDMALFHPVTDVQGLNRVSRTVLTNAANAMAGMALGRPAAAATEAESAVAAPLIALTMMGVTTPGVQRAQQLLEAAGFETIVFHANGSGGRAMEEMIAAGEIDGVLDLTTSEITAEHFGGILSAGPDRLCTAGRAGIPQVVSTGALEVLNFGPRLTVPAAYDDESRPIVIHNPSITSIRATAAEAAEVGAILGTKVSASTGPTAVLLPLGGCTKYELPGGPFTDAAIDAALFRAIRAALRRGIVVRDVRANLNEPAFAEAVVSTFVELWVASGRRLSNPAASSSSPATL